MLKFTIWLFDKMNIYSICIVQWNKLKFSLIKRICVFTMEIIISVAVQFQFVRFVDTTASHVIHSRSQNWFNNWNPDIKQGSCQSTLQLRVRGCCSAGSWRTWNWHGRVKMPRRCPEWWTADRWEKSKRCRFGKWSWKLQVTKSVDSGRHYKYLLCCQFPCSIHYYLLLTVVSLVSCFIVYHNYVYLVLL